MRDLTLQESRDYTYEGRCRLWGQDVFVGLDLPEREDKARALEAALPAVEQRLEWLENNRAGVEKALLDDGGPDLAQEWASSAELAEEEDAECYIMEDGQKVFFPITPEAFCASLRPESLVLNGKEGNGRCWSVTQTILPATRSRCVWRRTERYRPAAFSVRMP